jgi:phage/plasmid-associated DNA primase
MDHLGDFLADRCVTDTKATVAAADLYDAYKAWAQQNGEPTLSNKALGLHLRERGCVAARTNRARGWVGLRLRTVMDEPAVTGDASVTPPAGSPPTRAREANLLETASPSVIASQQEPGWISE